MLEEYISQEEITKNRTPSDHWNWMVQKVNQICSTPEGLEYFRLQNGPRVKQLIEEVTPLAIFGMHKYADNNQILLQPVIGNQPYDAVITDMGTDPLSQIYLEITQSHEGNYNYRRRCELLEKGNVFSYAPVIKKSTKKGWEYSIPQETIAVEEGVEKELRMILAAAKRKAGKNYPANTSLVIYFDDALFLLFEKAMAKEKLDSFVVNNILNLYLNFSALYLVGHIKYFREFSLTP